MNMHAEMELPFPAMQKGFPQAGMQYVPACGNPFCVLLYPFPFLRLHQSCLFNFEKSQTPSNP
jgi:hypothetical protein